MTEERKKTEERQKEEASGARQDFEKRTVFTEMFNLFSLVGFLYGALDERLSFREGMKKQFEKPVWYYRTRLENNLLACLGGISFLLYLFMAATGILLLMYYRPTTADAYRSVVDITNQVPYGWLIRGIHRWGANLMIVTVLLHMMRVFFTAAYRPPRDVTWVNGVLLLVFTLAFSFSGYLLPWNQVSYWSTTVGTDIMSAIPVVGDTLKYFVRGGNVVGQLALTRFFAFHVVILPGLMILFLVLHFLMIRRQGIAEPL
ncbi:MAG: cytochrome b N-terminal domain-containing protein, partial [Deltaproteobacteria bacterium]|nr:cytochrome b N-terminal domain-containing protein [Deltaproteobacteria bacterium]